MQICIFSDYLCCCRFPPTSNATYLLIDYLSAAEKTSDVSSPRYRLSILQVLRQLIYLFCPLNDGAPPCCLKHCIFTHVWRINQSYRTNYSRCKFWNNISFSTNKNWIVKSVNHLLCHYRCSLFSFHICIWFNDFSTSSKIIHLFFKIFRFTWYNCLIHSKFGLNKNWFHSLEQPFLKFSNCNCISPKLCFNSCVQTSVASLKHTKSTFWSQLFRFSGLIFAIQIFVLMHCNI